MTHLQGPPRAPSSTPVCQDSLSHHGPPGSCGPNGRAARTAAWTNAEPSLVLSHTQNKHLFRSLSKWGGRNTSQVEYATSKMQRDALGAVPHFWLLEGPEEQLILYLRHDILTCPHHLSPRSFTTVEGSCIFVRFISHPLTCKYQ